MSLCPGHKGLLRWSYIIILVSLLPPDLLSFVTSAADVIQFTFDGYRIIWVYCSCLCQDALCTPLIIAATSRFCSVLTLFVVNEAVLLVVFLFLLHRSFTVCYLYVSFSIRCWVLQVSHNHSSFPYHLLGLLMSTLFSPWFLFTLPRPPWPPIPPLPRSSLPSNWPLLSPLPPLTAYFTCRLRPYIPDDVWVAGERRNITIDKYVEAVSKISLWLDMQILTSVFKSLFGQFMLSNSCLTLSFSYRGTI